MTKQLNLNVRVSGELGEFVSRMVSNGGLYENTSEYSRDLIRRDKQAREAQSFERLKAELQRAFAAPEGSGVAMTAEAFLARHKTTRQS